MKRKYPIIIAIVFCAALIVAVIAGNRSEGLVSAFTFPFAQIACGLRALAESGKIGSGASLALWVAVSAIPAAAAFVTKKKKTLPEKCALCVLSLTILFALFALVNISVFCRIADDEYLTECEAMIGGTVWSVIILCIVLRVISLLNDGNKEHLLKYFRIALVVIGAAFAAAAAISLVGAVNTLSVVNETAPPDPTDRIVGVLKELVLIATYILDIVIAYKALMLFEITDDSSEEVRETADRLCRSCCAALGISCASTALLNIVQIILIRRISDISVSVVIPVFSIVFVLSVLLISRLTVENRDLRDDNELFI